MEAEKIATPTAPAGLGTHRPAVAAFEPDEYVSRRAGERMTGLSWRGFKKLADQGLFRTLELPGLDVKYHRGDIAAVITRAQRSARPVEPAE